MTQRFLSKVVLVTGGTGGLGKAVTLAFLEQGAKVAVTYVVPEEMGELKRAAGPLAGSLTGHSVDATNVETMERFVQQIVAEYGQLDVVVNTIGAYAGGPKLWEIEPRIFEQQLKLNLDAGYVIMRAVVPAMLKRGSGAIVNIASKAAIDHAGGAAAYAASKAAAVAMIDSLAADLRATGVRANSILPSIIDTEANRKAMPKADFAQWPKPEEIARVILFLCSEDAKLIHGASIPVYGQT
jgi:NAD(P)-dependent dehydrogenase (short-subunit alcohol dehydrogenase family)